MTRNTEDLQVIGDALYSVDQTARLLHIHKGDLLKMVKTGSIAYVRITDMGHVRFPGWMLRDWINSRARGGHA